MVMASVNESRSDESQASQLLAAALRPRDLPPAIPAPATTEEPQSGPHEGSLQSSGHSMHYHMHGLVATQTQSLVSGEDQPHPAGSQKENTPASWDKGQSSPPAGSSPVGSPVRSQPPPSYTGELKESPSNIFPVSKALVEKSRSKEIGERTNTLQSPAKGGKAVSFVSPSRLPSRPPAQLDRASTLPARAMPPPPRPRPRSPSPTSQDSFAGPLPQSDPAKAFIAQTRTFAIPLSQLGDTQSTSDEEGPPPVASDMWTSPRHDPAVRGSAPQEKVLVVGTPSNSSRDSQSQQRAEHSQQSLSADSQSAAQIDTQSYDSYPQAQVQTLDPADFPSLTQEDGEPSQMHARHSQPSSPGYASTEPTSSYQHLLDDVFKESQPDEETPPTQLATQVTEPADETPPTQIATPMDDLDASAIAHDHDFINVHGQYEAPSIRSNARSTETSRRTDRHGLLSLIAPEKRYRYEHIVPEPGPRVILPSPSPARHVSPTKESQPSDIPSSPATGHETQASEFVERTQPSDVAVNGSVISTLPRRGLPPANRVMPTRRPQSPAPSSPLSAMSGFVPDSEGPTQGVDMGPTQIADAPAPPARRGIPSASPATSRTSPSVAHIRTQLQSEDEVLRTITTEKPSVPAIAEEEEEEEEEEEAEVPLAAAVQSSKAKGKQKATELTSRPTAPSSPVKTRGQAAKPPQSPTKNVIIRDVIGAQWTASWRDVVIPSSDPQERREDAKAAATAKSRKPRTPVQQTPLPPRTRTAPRAAKLAARGKLQESSTEDEDEDDGDEADTPDYDDHDAVPADEDDMDVDPPDVKPKLPVRNNKRKRTVSSTSRKVPSKPSGSKVKEESATPATRPAKRAKTASVIRGAGNHVPTRVFGLWRQNGQYYPGVAMEMVGSKCRVKFDDEDEETLELKHLRLCQLKPGDSVLHQWSKAQKGVPVVDVPECAETGLLATDVVTIQINDEDIDVEVRTIRIAARTVQAEWDDRLLTEDTIIPQVRPRPSRPSPTPSRLSVPSEGSVRGATTKPLAKTGLVMSFSPNSEYLNTKNNIMAQIKRHGGVVLDDWTNLYTMEGVVEFKSQLWTLTADDIQWKKTKDIDRVFLISDDSHQKPKFLIALALGIPCVSVEWLQAVISAEDVDWHRYLLPAGFSEQLNARVSQMVDLDWGNSIHHLTDVTANLVAPKVFADKTILCISPDFVPRKQKGKKNGNASDKNVSVEMVPRIILCMGAATVESVGDSKYATRPLEDYDLVVVNKDQDLKRYSEMIEHCVDMSWVKDCLISRQFRALPSQQDS